MYINLQGILCPDAPKFQFSILYMLHQSRVALDLGESLDDEVFTSFKEKKGTDLGLFAFSIQLL